MVYRTDLISLATKCIVDLVKAANKQDYEKLDFVTKFYGKDLCKEQVKVQLDILATNLSPRTGGYDLPSLLKQLKELSEAQNPYSVKSAL